ncbi:teneurin-m-like isoform X2 [Elysia marginata]|uniref:Teneurin-m-like isoform X2 n=1 Tax=Elysia marginata TaxID=1093978 RepID=A0AAV4GQK4_9GAST|nr:teneurin-m-like isoform X2 [Elysia marginata]
MFVDYAFDAMDCLVPNCSGNGQCIHGKCRCFRGFKGEACEVQDKINITELCASRCSGNGLYDMKTGSCECFRHFSGLNCETEICRLECAHGKCQSQRCVCDPGWSGALCDQLECNHRCDLHGKCQNGTCMCTTGWNGKYCTIHGMTDCMDPDCCLSPLTGEPLAVCANSDYCKASREPIDVLLSVSVPAPTVPFLKKVDFLIDSNSVQRDAPKHSFNDSQASVIRGRVVAQDGTPLIGVRVGVVTQPLYGYTMTRKEGYFDILVNGGGSVELDFSRDPFKHKTASVLVPWNQIITMDTVKMSMSTLAVINTGGSDCSSLDTTRADHRLRPVVLSTWKHTQLGACPERSTIIPESQVLQESLVVPGTDVHLVYHSSESSGYMSLILIQMTPATIPSTLSRVHLKVSVEGVTLTKMFEADTNLKYTFAWDRENAYKQPVYGIVTARVHVGYQHLSCSRIYWETQSATLNGYDMTASHIGGWNLDIHHTYNYQEGILHKGDGTNIYLKEKPKKIITILGNGQRRLDKCNLCNGKAKGNSLLSPMALASGLDGSLYVGDYNFIRKLSPDREEIASIMQQRSDTTPYTYYMTVSPVDGRLYITDFMEKKIKRVRTMGPVPDLERNFDLVAGTGESCTPSEDRCGDGGLAVNAKLSYPKGIAIDKDGIIYVADGSNVRKITRDGKITTLIGSQTEITQWEPPSCNMAMPADKARLKWPKSLAINPLDDSLHILDDNIVFKLTDDFKLVIVAGRPKHCPKNSGSSLPTGVLTDDEQASSEADQVVLNSAVNIAFGPHGDLYIVESDKNHINRVRVVTSNGRIHHFAGAKSKCNCQSDKCSCFNPDEALAAQALFSDPTSVTVTPDGVVHLSDMGNLRVFSVVSELPSLKDGHYNVVAPETQELYIFNMYGQHRHTVNINTGQYVYNFTYNVFSSYGKLQSISDSANNVIQVDRQSSRSLDIVSPSGQSCKLEMDERGRLQKFKSSVGNVETRFSYTVSTGLLKWKEDSWGQTYLYSYDETGRLLNVRQPTGQVTSLTTDINTSGSIVRMATGSRHVSAMATYGSVQSVLHGKCLLIYLFFPLLFHFLCYSKEDNLGSTATNVTYLPDGAVVVQFPSNLTVAIETGNHPVMDKENRMHYKRKVIVPGLGVHRLEWRFYLRRGPSLQNPGKKVINRIGNRMRVGSLATQHVVHGSLGGEGREKALMINGNNLLTVEYDRRAHTETVRDKSQRDIITIVYNSEGLPMLFLPASSHHMLNITYNHHGDIVQWEYGNLTERRTYKDPGLVKSIEGDRPGGTMHRFFYRNSDHPTDVFLHSGKQYKIVLDEHGNLARIMTPFLGYHHFNMLLSLGLHRFFYKPPGINHFYIEDYDAMGKLLRVIYPSEQRRVVYRYNELGQRSLTMFDQTLIDHTYHPGVGLMSLAALKSNGYHNTLSFRYLSSLISEISMTFPRDAALVGARIILSYDGNFRQKNTRVMLSNNIGSNSSLKYSEDTGKMVEIGGILIKRLKESHHTLSRKTMVATRLYNNYGRLTDVKVTFNSKTHFSMEINYDKSGRVHVWRHAISSGIGGATVRSNDLISTEYIYDVDSHLKVVLVKSEIKWQFGYDADGNINRITSGGKTGHIEFDLGDKITMMGGIPYKFDSDGFMAQRGLDHVTFNSAGQLVSVTRHTEFKFTYFYDALGRLVAQRDRYGRILQFFYGNVRKKEEVTHVYNHTTGHLTEYFRDEAGALIGMERADHFYHVVCDPSHSPLAIFSEDGALKKQVSYTPLGVRNVDSNPDFDLAFGFQGGIYNPTTRLVHFHERVYDATLGRFLSPDYAQVLPKLEKVLLEPQTLNLYSHRYLVNLHLQNEQFPRTDLAHWLNVLGFDIRSLAPDVSYTGELNPSLSSPNMQLLPAASAFECTFRRDMKSLLTISTVPQSKVTPSQKNRLLKKVPAPLPSLFGPGVTISDHKGVATVNIVEGEAPAWASKLATVLLNGSLILPISFTIHGRDVHFFVKQSAQQAKSDLRDLGLHNSVMFQYENGINVSVHYNQKLRHSYHTQAHEEVHVRIHGNHTVLNVRYGTTLEREMRRVLKHAKDRAVGHAWAREKYLLQHSLPSLNHWSDNELEQIRDLGSAMGYVADYIHQPDQFPELADDCNNIKFVPEKP